MNRVTDAERLPDIGDHGFQKSKLLLSDAESIELCLVRDQTVGGSNPLAPTKFTLDMTTSEQRDVSLILETGKFELDAARPAVRARWQG